MVFERKHQRDVERGHTPAHRANRRENCVRDAVQGAQTWQSVAAIHRLGRASGEKQHLGAFRRPSSGYTIQQVAGLAAHLGNVGPHPQGGQDRHRGLETALQYRHAALIAGISAASARGNLLAARSVRQQGASANTVSKLILQLGHSVGAGQ
jgi:hypothetical protein